MDGQVLKGGKVLPKEIGIFGQGGAVALILTPLFFYIGQVEGLGHQIQQLCPVETTVIEGDKGGIGHLIAPPRKKEIAGRLQLQLRVPLRRLLECQSIGRLGLPGLSQLRQPAGDFDRIHTMLPHSRQKRGPGTEPGPRGVVAVIPFRSLTGGAGGRPGAPGWPGPAWPERTAPGCCSWCMPSSRRPRRCRGWWTRRPGCSPASQTGC